MSIATLRRKNAKGKTARRVLARLRRHARVLKKVRGTGERPRLIVRRSLRHMEAQLVDDDRGVCVTGISTRAKEVQSGLGGDERGKTAQSRLAGRLMAERAKARGIERVVFDRGGYRYHGRVQAFAEGAREGGLKF
ncbi:MAG: 50S ribosomal protein L18 [Gemmatimonadota bacterium]|nr:MAG: 50S ribosomal protein L18 [Gemmatimonadota bacterium]